MDHDLFDDSLPWRIVKTPKSHLSGGRGELKMADDRGTPERIGKSSKRVTPSSQGNLVSNPDANSPKMTREKIIEEQRKHIAMLEKRLHDAVRAFKVVSQERDKLLASQAKLEITQANDPTRQGRIAELEAKLTEISALCGQREKEHLDDQIKIKELEDRCAHLEMQLDRSIEAQSTTAPIEVLPPSSKLRNRATQTEIEEEDDDGEDENQSQDYQKPEMFSVETQTETSKNFKELAIVLPFPSKNEESPDSIPNDEAADHAPTVAQEESQRADNLNVSPSVSESPPYEPTHDPRFSFDSQAQGSLSDVRGRHISEAGASSVTSTQGLSIFYVNELARKEIELAEAKLKAREFECALREMQWKYNVDKFK